MHASGSMRQALAGVHLDVLWAKLTTVPVVVYATI